MKTFLNRSGFFFLQNKFKNIRKTLNQFFYGMTVYELELEFSKEKNRLNNLLMLTVFGDIAGLPLFPSYYSMRLLPYIIPTFNTWKRNLYREKDITDIFSTDI
ncbi:MAG: hypothetical protein JXN64_05405 [Spirochaetes bacterium]|nr:hypothetical protein [Spirochaetota bacterium]